MSDKKRKDPKTAEPVEPHLREAHLAEGIEKYVPPAFAPVSVNPMLGQSIALLSLPPPETPFIHKTAKTSSEESKRKKSNAT
jgi:hypothetical protein